METEVIFKFQLTKKGVNMKCEAKEKVMDLSNSKIIANSIQVK
jgi:hypothetical protein